jgi:hypothetical protein
MESGDHVADQDQDMYMNVIKQPRAHTGLPVDMQVTTTSGRSHKNTPICINAEILNNFGTWCGVQNVSPIIMRTFQ